MYICDENVKCLSLFLKILSNFYKSESRNSFLMSRLWTKKLDTYNVFSWPFSDIERQNLLTFEFDKPNLIHSSKYRKILNHGWSYIDHRVVLNNV